MSAWLCITSQPGATQFGCTAHRPVFSSAFHLRLLQWGIFFLSEMGVVLGSDVLGHPENMRRFRNIKCLFQSAPCSTLLVDSMASKHQYNVPHLPTLSPAFSSSPEQRFRFWTCFLSVWQWSHIPSRCFSHLPVWLHTLFYLWKNKDRGHWGTCDGLWTHLTGVPSVLSRAGAFFHCVSRTTCPCVSCPLQAHLPQAESLALGIVQGLDPQANQASEHHHQFPSGDRPVGDSMAPVSLQITLDFLWWVTLYLTFIYLT